MTQIPPTTAYEIDAPDESPCCGAPVELVSPPLGYECRECMAQYQLRADPDAQTCQVTKADGELCGRDLPCQYHS